MISFKYEFQFYLNLEVCVFVGKQEISGVDHKFSYHQMSYSNKGNFFLVIDEKNNKIRKVTMQGKGSATTTRK